MQKQQNQEYIRCVIKQNSSFKELQECSEKIDKVNRSARSQAIEEICR